MEILNSRAIKQFVREHPDAEAPLREWVAKTRAAEWKNNSDVLKTFRSADHLGDQKFIFNIGGNKYRLIAYIRFEKQIVYVKAVLSHRDYDKGAWKS